MANNDPASSARVLLAEDSDINLEVTLQFLQRDNISVAVARDGCAALEWLAREKFDCVLMDCQMPGMDGYETTQALRAGKAGEINVKTPVIAITAHALEGERQRCLDAGMDDYLPKPFSMQQICQKVREHIPEPTA